MEKLTGAKHNHLFTDLIKVFIFGLMLLLPFLCFLPTGFYYGFNEHAEATITPNTTVNLRQEVINGKPNGTNNISSSCPMSIEQYNGTYKNWLHLDCNNDTFSITFDTDLTINANDKIYFSLDCAFDSADTISFNLYCDNNDIFLRNQYINQAPYSISFITTINNNDTNCSFAFYSTEDEIEDAWLSNVQIFNLTQIFGSGNEPSKEIFETYLTQNYYIYGIDYEIIIAKGKTISDAMAQAWQGVWTSPLFNWTNTTPLNTGLNGFIGIFGINQSSYIANCLIYLLTITAIYVVFDIVLGMFKWLTHLINK